MPLWVVEYGRDCLNVRSLAGRRVSIREWLDVCPVPSRDRRPAGFDLIHVWAVRWYAFLKCNFISIVLRKVLFFVIILKEIEKYISNFLKLTGELKGKPRLGKAGSGDVSLLDFASETWCLISPSSLFIFLVFLICRTKKNVKIPSRARNATAPTDTPMISDFSDP